MGRIIGNQRGRVRDGAMEDVSVCFFHGYGRKLRSDRTDGGHSRRLIHNCRHR